MSLEPSSRPISGDWPTCPGCGERRSTACPYCHTAGAEFRTADFGFERIEGLTEVSGTPGPCCGPGGCHSEGPGDCHSDSASDELPALPAGVSEPLPTTQMLLCPTCDEPFVPQYLRRCEWCGHEFPEGVEIDPPADDFEESFNPRIAITIVAILALAGAGFAYFVHLF